MYDNFLEEGGEFVVFGDENQDIYRKQVFGTIPNLGGHVWGRWKELNIGYRVTNQSIIDLAAHFQSAFLKNGTQITPFDRELTFDEAPKYHYLSASTSDEIIKLICDFVDNDRLDVSKTVILSQTIEILRGIDYAYRSKTGKGTIATCETKEVYDELLREHNDSATAKFFKDPIEEVRSNKKLHFTMASDLIKISTIHSFKGWEADNVFLIIQDVEENRPEIIYTALTRARHRLYIINLGNLMYHNFFRQHIQ